MNDANTIQNDYANTMGNQIKAFLESIAEGETHLDDLYEAKTKAAFESGSFDFDLSQELGNTGQTLPFKIKYPRYMARNMHPFLCDEAEVEGHMDVHTTAEQTTKTAAESGFEGEAKIGYGPISCKVKVHGKASISDERRRSTDARSGCKWRVLVKRQLAPEGIMMLIDAGAKYLDMDIGINMQLAQATINSIYGTQAQTDSDDEDYNDGEDYSNDDSDDDYNDDSDDSDEDYNDDSDNSDDSDDDSDDSNDSE